MVSLNVLMDVEVWVVDDCYVWVECKFSVNNGCVFLLVVQKIMNVMMMMKLLLVLVVTRNNIFIRIF